VLHGRNLDYDDAVINASLRLDALVFAGDFRRGNKTVFEAAAFAGQSGIYTAVTAPAQGPSGGSGAWSFEQNTRRDPTDGNLTQYINRTLAAVAAGAHLFTHVARSLMQRPRPPSPGGGGGGGGEGPHRTTWAEAVAALSAAPLSSAMYFVLAGSAPGEGAVVSRARGGAVDVHVLSAPLGRWCVTAWREEQRQRRTCLPASCAF
jgi:hypothetical protein